MLFECSADGKIYGINHKAASEDRENNRKRHNRIGQEGENTGFYKEPVLLTSVYCVSEISPDENHKYAEGFVPKLFPFESDLAPSHIEKSPSV